MQTYKSILFILFFTLILFSCKEEKKENKNIKNISEKEQTDLKNETIHLSDEDFGEIIELKGKAIKLNSNLNPSESELLIKGDSLIIMSPRSSKIFRIFSLPDFKLITVFGILGGGPDEFNSPHLVSTIEKDKFCYIYDANWQKLYYLKKDLSLFLTKNKFPKGKLHASFLKQIQVISKHDMFYATAAGEGKKIFHFIQDTTSIQNEIFDLSLDKKYNNWVAYTGNFGLNYQKDRMVYAYKYFREIKFMNLKANHVKNIIFDYKKTKAGDAVAMLAPTNITYYWKMSTTTEGVYVSYSGRTPIEVVRDEKKGKDYIHIEEFDWNGNPKRKFKLDKWGYFCVDGKRNKFYLLATNAEEPFYVYDLPK